MYGTIKQTGGCSAFLIKGPGQYNFSVTDEAWLQYNNVTTSEQLKSLLQDQEDILIYDIPCTITMVKFSRIP